MGVFFLGFFYFHDYCKRRLSHLSNSFSVLPLISVGFIFFLLCMNNELNVSFFFISFLDFQLHDLEIRVGDNEIAQRNPLCAWFPATLGRSIAVNSIS